MALDTSVNTTIDTIIIDGNEFSGYSDYFILNELTYSVEPVRSANGIMEDLDEIDTFIVPRLFLEFKYLEASGFRRLITILNSKKIYQITYYDQNDGISYTRPFYLKPYSKTKLDTFVKEGDAIFRGVRNFSIEFVCTLRDLLTSEG